MCCEHLLESNRLPTVRSAFNTPKSSLLTLWLRLLYAYGVQKAGPVSALPAQGGLRHRLHTVQQAAEYFMVISGVARVATELCTRSSHASWRRECFHPPELHGDHMGL